VKVFISYSRTDAGDFANQIHRHLSNFKYDTFTDVNDIRGGDVWSKTIEENISGCDIFVVIVTHGALQSPHVEKEVLQAQTENKKIIPCFHRSITNRYIDKLELNKIQGVEFSDKYELARDLYLMIDIKPINKPLEDSNGTKIGGKFSYHSDQWYIDKAKDFEYLGQYDRALKQYEKAIEKEPFNFLAVYSKALFLERIEKFNEALVTIEQAIDIQPKNTDVWYHKACILEKLQKYEDAINALNIDLKLDSKDVKSWISKANLLEQMERYEEEIEAIDEIIKIDSNNIDALEKKGKILEKLKHYEDAINCYDHILEMQPNTHAILIRKGHVLQKLDKYQEAIECYDNVLNSESENIEVRIERCVAISKTNRYHDAVTCYDETIQLDSDNKLLWLSKGNILYKNLRQYKEAIECYDKVLELDPDDQDSKKNKENALNDLKKERFAYFINTANSYYENKDYLKVIELSDKAIDIDQQNYKPYLYKANSFQQLSRYEEAISCYDKVLSIDANNQEAISNKDIAKANIKKQKYLSIIEEIKISYTNKDYSQVIVLSDKSVKLEPDNPISYLYKGHAFNELKKYEEAIQCYDKILEIDPNNVDAFNKRKIAQEQLDKQLFEQKKSIDNWLNQGDNFFTQGKYNEAIECYYKALEIDPNNKVAQNDIKLANERLFKEKSECYISWSDIKHKKIYSVDRKMMGKIEKISKKYIMIEEGRIKKKKFWLPKFLANVYIGGNIINMNYLCLDIKKDEIKQRYYYDEEPADSQYDLDRNEFNTKYGKNKSNFSSEYIKCYVIKM
jgi:tetratricopeptide (TPR) repeat protein